MGKTKIVLIAFSVLITAVLTGWLFTRYYIFTDKKKIDIPLIELKEDSKNREGMPIYTPEGNMVLIKIFYPSVEGMSSEERRVQYDPMPVIMAEIVVTEYLKGLKGGLQDTKLRGGYRDRQNVLYLDLSDDFRRNFSGDARQEYYLLKSLFETVMANIVDIEDVRLLIESMEIESIGGHFFSLYGLKGTISSH